MKKNIVALLIGLLLSGSLRSQTMPHRLELSAGVGLFLDINRLNILSSKDHRGVGMVNDYGVAPGWNDNKVLSESTFWGGAAYKLNTKYALTGHLYYVKADNDYVLPASFTASNLDKNRYYRSQIGIRRTFDSGSRMQFDIGLGFIYQHEVYYRPVFNQPVLYSGYYGSNPATTRQLVENTGGIDLDLVYRFRISDKTAVGMKFNTYYLYQKAVDALSLSPVVSFRF